MANCLSTVMAADDLTFIEGGGLVEQGGLAEMLKSKGRIAGLFGDAGMVRDVA
jgi:ABC-type transport system involved in Fe-S cluster assembly fused permease/ATPase subunit